MLDLHVRDIETWLAVAPHMTAVDVLTRLNERAPGAFGPKQLRTLQRFVRYWRARTAKRLIDGAAATITIEAPGAVPAGTAPGVNLAHSDDPLGNITP